MPRTHPAYAPEFRRQMVELVRSGRSVDSGVRALSGGDTKLGQAG